jgi:excisionase family DNA binding protein
MPTEYLTPLEASRQLRLSRAMLYKLIHEGLVPAVRHGSVYRIPSRGLQEYLDRARVSHVD